MRQKLFHESDLIKTIYLEDYKSIIREIEALKATISFELSCTHIAKKFVDVE